MLMIECKVLYFKNWKGEIQMKKLYELIGRITLVTLGIAIAFILMQKSMIYVIEVEDSMPLPKGQIEIERKSVV